LKSDEISANNKKLYDIKTLFGAVFSSYSSYDASG